MLFVALETSTERPSVAVADGDRLVQAWLAGDRPHASDLLPSLEALLVNLRRKPREIDVVAVGRGPGSYTGLRVGAATALGLARGAGATLIGVSSYAAFAWRELAVGEQAAFLFDARADELYFAHYKREQDDVVAVVEPRALRRDDVAGALPASIPIFTQRGIERVAPSIADQLGRARYGATAQASAVLELAQRMHARGVRHELRDIEPLYLRGFATKNRRT